MGDRPVRPPSRRATCGRGGGAALRLAALLALAAASDALAQDRLVRRFGTADGLVPANVFSLAQDRDGFLWIGTSDGLYRFDGQEMRRWAPETLRGRVVGLAAGPGGETLALAEHGGLFAVTAGSLAPVAGAGGDPVVDAVGLAWYGEGCRWIARAVGVEAVCPQGGRRSWSRDRFGGEAIRALRPARAGVLVLTAHSVWRATRDSPPIRVLAAEGAEDALDLPHGRTLAVTWRHGVARDLRRRGARAGLETLFAHAPGFRLAASFGSAEAALEAVRLARLKGREPDWELALMDLQLPGLGGIAATRRLKRLLPGIAVVVLTVFEEPQTVLEAIRAGADGYLLKQTPPAELLAELRAVRAGGAPLTAGVARTVLDLLRAEPGGAPAKKGHSPQRLDLTDREQEVLRCLVQGLAYKQAAARLGISVDTVRAHVRNIYGKLQVHSAAEAVGRAVRERLV